MKCIYVSCSSEWIYPVDEALEKQLRQVAYFSGTAHRNRVVAALMEQDEGAFVIRLSESRRRCLALSVRVPFSHNSTGIAHYLIIRNDKGFKLKVRPLLFSLFPFVNSEWIYPVDEALEKQLRQVAYFSGTAHRNRVVAALMEQDEGAFVIRLSESRRRCLALSVRVPFSHNSTGIAHYLIIRNDKGFKLKGPNKYFQSIPMLVTHHSVMPEQLPCRLMFVHWGNTWKSETNNNYEYPPCD
ncbi:unnamed protein product [Gongylonema pulchrum]|uniref:SH2 domain-containing protein n=1 Tax=Gongylonema pulchrum TaxID=637853 RepID=A0A183DUA4_9BILA|nr:unnamed protein product [Gongylonema pulchrum]